MFQLAKENLWVGTAIAESAAVLGAVIDSDESGNQFRSKYNAGHLDNVIGNIVFINFEYEPIEPELFEITFECIVPDITDNG